jgi:hypothetical protein
MSLKGSRYFRLGCHLMGFGRWLGHEGSNLTNGLIHYGFIIWWHYWEVVEAGMGPLWRSRSRKVHPGRVYLVHNPFSLFLCFLATIRFLCHTLPQPWCSALPHVQSNGANQPSTETSETVSQNKPFLLYIGFSQVFCYRNENMTNTGVLFLA